MEENINSKMTKSTNQTKGKVNQQQKTLKQLNINPVKPKNNPQKKFGEAISEQCYIYSDIGNVLYTGKQSAQRNRYNKCN